MSVTRYDNFPCLFIHSFPPAPEKWPLTWIGRLIETMEFCGGTHRVFEQLKQDVVQQCWYNWKPDLPSSQLLCVYNMNVGREDGAIVLEKDKLGRMGRVLDQRLDIALRFNNTDSPGLCAGRR